MRGAHRLAKVPPGSPIAITGGGGPPSPMAVRSASIPGGGVTLSRAIGRELQQSTMAEGERVAYTTAHWQSRHTTGELPSPQQYVRMTGQGSPHSKEGLESVPRVRLARRSLSRNRGLAPGV
jgi:hypothetical protein